MTNTVGIDTPFTKPLVHRASMGWWHPDVSNPSAEPSDIRDMVGDLRSTVAVVHVPDGFAMARGGVAQLGGAFPGPAFFPLAAFLPPLLPEDLGDSAFCTTHGLKYPYMTGAMANGIGSADIVEAMSRAGMLGSFGAAGLSIDRITQAIDRLQATLGDKPFCFNLIHSPNEPAHEAAVTDLYLRRGVKLVEASAYLDLTPSIVRYRVSGLMQGPHGVIASHRVIAKVSRVEVATKFLSPPPMRILQELYAAGHITEHQIDLASRVPMCDDLTAEADSGGHTDNRPALTLLPTLLALRDRLQTQFGYSTAVRVGLAGGIATPSSVAAAFSMGAAYVVTGSVNQACIESGSSEPVRKMLAEAGQADVAMAPAADMFEMGVKVQVLKRGTMFAMRAGKLYEIYRQYPSWEAIPATERAQLEKTFFRTTFTAIWDETRDFFQRRDPTQLPKAEADPKHKMALVFRWYLGLSSRWANSGDTTRQLDYQVWCGPAMGAFNEWTKGTFLEQPANRDVVTVAVNLLYGACVQLRRETLRQQGIALSSSMMRTGPIERNELQARLG